ncbi:MAG: alkaline phosphatase [Pseudomonadota bacterium]|nr:alkaline phosphatase [Pseudomonadota bacterium]
MRKILSVAVVTTTLATQPLIADERAVILIVGDGFDDTHVTMGRNYLKGQAGQLLLDQMTFRGAVQIETVDSDGRPIYVADSANTMTTLASGAVTQIGRIGKNAADESVTTVLESAASAGYKTGIVSTASVTDASPAAFTAHVTIRACENPITIRGGEKYGVKFDGCPKDLKENGGMGSISEQLAVADVDVILGGGMEHFVAQYGSDPIALTLAKEKGVIVLSERDDLEHQHPGRVIGLFSEDTMPVAWRGKDGRVAESIERSWLNHIHQMIGSITQPEVIECEANPSFTEMPTLETMTRYAIDHLSRDNDKGFFLTIESASIDKKSHEGDACGAIGEIKQLEEALAVAMDYATENPNTLIMVTADHAQAAQIVPDPTLYTSLPIPVFSPGKVARIATPEGSVMRINYATNNIRSEEHTGANVPLFANSEGESVLSPFMRQRDIYDAMMRYLEL